MASKNAFQDPRGRHVRVYVDILQSNAWRALSWSARALYFDMRASLGKTNNGDLSATMQTLKHAGWSSPATLSAALYQLRALGFIERTRGGGVERGSKVCSLYAFTDEAVLAMPGKGITARNATFAYRLFQTIREAERARDERVAEYRAEAIAMKQAAGLRKKTTLQKMKRHATDSVAVEAIDATDSVAETPLTLQKMKQRRRGAKRPAARMESSFPVTVQ